MLNMTTLSSGEHESPDTDAPPVPVTASDTLTHVAAAGARVAEHYAARGTAPPELWVVVTTSYRVPAGDAVAFVQAAREPHALAGVRPAHVEVGIHHASEARPTPLDRRPQL